MKKTRFVISILAAALLALGLCACSSSDKTEALTEIDLGGSMGTYSYEGLTFVPTDLSEENEENGAVACYYCDGYDKQYGLMVYRFASEGRTTTEVAMDMLVKANGYEDEKNFESAIYESTDQDGVLGKAASNISYLRDETEPHFCTAEIYADGEDIVVLEWWFACEEVQLAETGYSMWVPVMHQDYNEDLITIGDKVLAYYYSNDFYLGSLDVVTISKTDAIDSVEAAAAADTQNFVDNGITYSPKIDTIKTYGQQIDALLAYGDMSQDATSANGTDGETYASSAVSYYIDCGDQILQVSIYESEGFYENSFCGYIMGLHKS